MKKTFFFFILFLSTQPCRKSYAVGESVGLEAVKAATAAGKEITKVLVNGSKDVGINAAEKIRESATTLAEGAKDIGINSATKIAEAVKKITYAAWAGIGTVASYMGYRITADIKDRLHKKHQEHDLRVAKQVLLDLLVKNANGKMKLFGRPEGCEKAACTLAAMPGGEDELKKIIEIFKRNIRNL